MCFTDAYSDRNCNTDAHTHTYAADRTHPAGASDSAASPVAAAS